MINFTANTTPETSNNPRHVLVGSWLLVMCAMVLVMVLAAIIVLMIARVWGSRDLQM